MMNLSVKDAARLLSVSEKTIYRWINQEIIPSYRIHGFYRFNRAELIEWATSRRIGVNPVSFGEPVDERPLPTLSEALAAGGVYYRIEGASKDAVLVDAVDHLRLPDEVRSQSPPSGAACTGKAGFDVHRQRHRDSPPTQPRVTAHFQAGRCPLFS